MYISCETNERDRPEVKSLSSWDFYRCLEEAIDRCDAYVAVVGEGYNSATWKTTSCAMPTACGDCVLVRARGFSRLRSTVPICRHVLPT